MALRATIVVCLVVQSAALRADERWGTVVRRGSFLWHSDREGSESKRRADEALDWLESLQADVESTLGMTADTADESRPIRLFVFGTQRAYRRALAARAPEVARRPACYIEEEDGPSIYVVDGRDLQKNVRHEATHALLHRALPFVPLWLDEGIAVYFESPADRQAEPEHLAGLRWSMRLGWRPDLGALEGRRDLAAMTAGDYRHAWAWVHFLLHESDDSSRALTDYLESIRSGAPPASPGEWIRRRLPNAERRFLVHFDGWGKQPP